MTELDELARIKTAGPHELALRLEWAVGMLRVITSPKVEDLAFARLIAMAGLDLATGDEEAIANADNAEAGQSLTDARNADQAAEARALKAEQERDKLKGENERLRAALRLGLELKLGAYPAHGSGFVAILTAGDFDAFQNAAQSALKDTQS